MEGKKVAIVHDWLTNVGGAEDVVEALHDMFPSAPIYTSMCIKENLSPKLQTADIRTSFLQKKVKGRKGNHQKYLPFMPTAFERFNLQEYDLVISSCSCCSKGIVTRSDAMHICYCHTPTRYVWNALYEYIDRKGKLKQRLIHWMMLFLRQWDYAAAQRVDYFIANSKYVAQRIKKYYSREAAVIYPPADIEFFRPDESVAVEDFYLVVSRLVKYKRIDIAVEAFNELGLPLVIIGKGEQLEYLKSIAYKNVKFLGRQSDEVVRDHMRRCRALIFPGEEDFGITPVEVQACGRPVIAYGKGGALETVVNGCFFDEQTKESLISVVRSFDTNKNMCRGVLPDYSLDCFKSKVTRLITEITSA